MSDRRYSLLRYIGGKYRITPAIAEHLHRFGKDFLIDVFGGSAAVVLNAGFTRWVYNDIDGDLVNLFQVVSDPELRRQLLRRLRWLPMSRQQFMQDYDLYRKNGFSFSAIDDSVERARAVLYRSAFAFGGKLRTGGFQVSLYEGNIKEIRRYQNILRRLVEAGHFFKTGVLENLHYSKCISLYGQNPHAVIYCDPPYDTTEQYYGYNFTRADHVYLAQQLGSCPAPVVVSYYKTDLICELYPADRWEYHTIASTKNSARICRGDVKEKHDELLLVRKDAA